MLGEYCILPNRVDTFAQRHVIPAGGNDEKQLYSSSVRNKKLLDIEMRTLYNTFRTERSCNHQTVRREFTQSKDYVSGNVLLTFCHFMPHFRLFTLGFLCCIVLAKTDLAENVNADTLGTNLFATQRHDFGQVALCADTAFQFELTNTLDSELRLLNLRSSCSCVSAQFSTTLLQPGETGAVVARLNTTGQHLHSKSSVLTIQLETVMSGTVRRDTVQFFVSGYIRPDVLLTPGSVEFGSVIEGTSAVRTVMLEYTGHIGWALTNIERSLPFIYARAEEVRRERGTVTYKITAVLKEEAPPGYVRDALRFTTNEFQSGRAEPIEIILPVHGAVSATMQAKPSPIQIGILSPGETAVKNIVIRSAMPFRITDVSASDNRFRFAFSEQASAVQLISVAFSAGRERQDIADVIRIDTSDAKQSVIVINAVGRTVD